MSHLSSTPTGLDELDDVLVVVLDGDGVDPGVGLALGHGRAVGHVHAGVQEQVVLERTLEERQIMHGHWYGIIFQAPAEV